MSEPNKERGIMYIIDALKAGQSLAEPEGWKKLQNYINLAAAGAGIAAIFVPGLGAFLTPEVIKAAAGFLGTANIYLTTATTEKIGL